MLTFNPLKAINSTLPILLPCSGCIGCRIDKVDQWATRCVHESQMHEYNSFITLTYSKDHLPENYSVSVRTFQLFMKRLRKEIAPAKIRFFACGEYGEQNLRPHYHALIFGYAFPDRVIYARTKDGTRYLSEQLNTVWPYGKTEVGDLTYKSAAYCSGYVMKKIGGDMAASHYLRSHPDTGTTVQVEPEFSLQSRRPGIGATWFAKFQSDAFPSDFLIIDGRHKPVPRYYFLKLQEEERQTIGRKRKLRSASPKNKANRTKARLAVRETIKSSRLQRLKRTLKDDDQ